MVTRKCCVPNCQDKTSTRHRFPKNDRQRMKIWLERIQNLSFESMDYQVIHKSYRICKKHFAEDCYSPGRIQLNGNAVPSLNLPGMRWSSRSSISEANERMSVRSVKYSQEILDKNRVEEVIRNKLKADTFELERTTQNSHSRIETSTTMINNRLEFQMICSDVKNSEQMTAHRIDKIENSSSKLCESSDNSSISKSMANSSVNLVDCLSRFTKNIQSNERLKSCTMGSSNTDSISKLNAAFHANQNIGPTQLHYDTRTTAEHLSNTLVNNGQLTISPKFKELTVTLDSKYPKYKLSGNLARYEITKKNKTWMLRPKFDKKTKETLLQSILASRKNMMKKCIVPGCTDTSSMRHRFPKRDEARLKLWLDAISNPVLNGVPTNKIYDSHRVCHSHFADNCFSPGFKRLKCNAIPTLRLPDKR